MQKSSQPFVRLGVDPLVPPLNDTSRLVSAISNATGAAQAGVREKLLREEQNIGSTVATESQRLGVEPNVWSDNMFRLYAESDAYMYDSAVWNRSRPKLAMRQWIGRYIAHFATRRLVDAKPKARDVLVHGDGLGFESLYLALCGHRVTYFEVSQNGMRFAQQIFNEAGVDVNFVTDASQLGPAMFDVVVSLDVLEHVPEPGDMVTELVSYLRPDGRLLVSAPFYAVCPERFPTHLRSNLRYAGDWKFFESFGLQLVDGAASWSPLVFRKHGGQPLPPESRAMRRWKLRVGGRFFSLARIVPWAFIPLVNRMLRPTPEHISDLQLLKEKASSSNAENEGVPASAPTQ